MPKTIYGIILRGKVTEQKERIKKSQRTTDKETKTQKRRQKTAETELQKANETLKIILRDTEVSNFINKHRHEENIMVSYGHTRRASILPILEIGEDYEIDYTKGLFLAIVSKKILSSPAMEARWKPISKEELEKLNLPKGVTGKIEFGETEENTDWLGDLSAPFTPDNCCLCLLERKHQQPFGHYLEKTDNLLPIYDVLRDLTTEKLITMIVKEAIPLEPEEGYPR